MFRMLSSHPKNFSSRASFEAFFNECRQTERTHQIQDEQKLVFLGAEDTEIALLSSKSRNLTYRL